MMRGDDGDDADNLMTVGGEPGRESKWFVAIFRSTF